MNSGKPRHNFDPVILICNIYKKVLKVQVFFVYLKVRDIFEKTLEVEAFLYILKSS